MPMRIGMSEGEQFSRLKALEKCPICGSELKKGYLNAPRGAYWGSEKHTLGFILLDSEALC